MFDFYLNCMAGCFVFGAILGLLAAIGIYFISTLIYSWVF